MPMSTGFEKRLFPIVAQLVKHYGDPFHIYDWVGIEDHVRQLQMTFRGVEGWRNYFAAKALPNPTILARLHQMGMGLDCSSVPELKFARQIGAAPGDIMFTSNNTTVAEFEEAQGEGGCILNLDDITLIDKVPEPFPSTICFRYNPGSRRTTSNEIIGNPTKSKYGVPHERIKEAYTRARERGAWRYGIQTMLVSNELDHKFMVGTFVMLNDVSQMVGQELGITFDFINIGGGFGIPYRPHEKVFDWAVFAAEAGNLQEMLHGRTGHTPKLYTESGRAITGPHGVLVATVANRMSKYVEIRGLTASMPDLMRPGMYGDDDPKTGEQKSGHHHITVLSPDGIPKTGPQEVVNVTGSLCEGNDVFALQRELPVMEEGDIVIIHDTGAHGQAMGFNYNGRLRPKELLLQSNGKVELIRRAERFDDYTRTLRFEPNIFTPAA